MNYYQQDRLISPGVPRKERRKPLDNTLPRLRDLSLKDASSRRELALKDASSLEERRDRLLAILSVAARRSSQVTSTDSDDVVEAKRLETDFLPILGMDVLYEPPQEMADVANLLPCLEAPPEADVEKQIAMNTPNDFQKNEQWGLLPRNEESNPVGGDAFTAWETYTGMGSDKERLIVAVVDTGCSMHPDLEPNLCKANDTECAGYDYGDDDPNPFDEPLNKVHGTSVTSIIAARSNNNYGIAGICWGCKIMCLKVHNSATNSITLSSLLRAYEHILKYNVKLSNHSYISFGYSKTEYKALTVMRERGHLLIVAAGNYGCDLDKRQSDGSIGCEIDGKNAGPATPATYALDNILTVGSIDRNGSLSYFSGYGVNSVDIMAPGSYIPVVLNTMKSSSSLVTTVAGTSFATPHVTGAAALVWGRNPQLSYRAVRNILLEKGFSLESLKGKSTTGKTLDIAAAVAAVKDGKIDKGWKEAAPTVDHTADYYNRTRLKNGNEERRTLIAYMTTAIIITSCFF